MTMVVIEVVVVVMVVMTMTIMMTGRPQVRHSSRLTMWQSAGRGMN